MFSFFRDILRYFAKFLFKTCWETLYIALQKVNTDCINDALTFETAQQIIICCYGSSKNHVQFSLIINFAAKITDCLFPDAVG